MAVDIGALITGGVGLFDSIFSGILNRNNQKDTNEINKEIAEATNKSNQEMNATNNLLNYLINSENNDLQKSIYDSVNRTNLEQTQLTNQANLEGIQQTNLSNQKIASDTNKLNKEISDSTNAINKQIAEQNLGFQRENLEYQKALQQQLFEREDTSYQRTVKDMQQAGISPLAMNGTNGAGGVVSTSPLNNSYQAQGYNAIGSTDLAPNFQAHQEQGYSTTKAEFKALQNLAYTQEVLPMFSGIANQALQLANGFMDMESKAQDIKSKKISNTFAHSVQSNQLQNQIEDLYSKRLKNQNDFRDFVWMNGAGLTPAMQSFEFDNPYAILGLLGQKQINTKPEYYDNKGYSHYGFENGIYNANSKLFEEGFDFEAMTDKILGFTTKSLESLGTLLNPFNKKDKK